MPYKVLPKSVAYLLALLSAQTGWAGIVIDGNVSVPAARPPAISARYQQIAGQIAAPEPATAIVFLEQSDAGSNKKRSDPLSLQQKGYQFAPGLLAIQAGDIVEFPNQDDDYHHVFSYSKTKSFDLGRYRMGETPPKVTFDAPGTVIVGCEIHDHMRGTILVLNTPYFTKTTPAGDYRLEIPEPLSGTFVLKAWISDRKVFEQNIELSDGASLKVDFAGN